AKDQFDVDIVAGIDKAWATWATAAGAPDSRILRQRAGGGWTAGPRAQEVHNLWKKARRELHRSDRDAAERAIGMITSIIDDATSQRLHSWRQRAERVIAFLPDGASGIDGHAVKWIGHLHRDSLGRLAQLLAAADQGRLPRF
ncbi:unnamed protein product, partial [Prorocentrum cordatum]